MVIEITSNANIGCDMVAAIIQVNKEKLNFD